jgi:hypothetical protein
MKTFRRAVAAAAVALFAASAAHAGPYILAGTDADDHGSVSAGVNQDGWFFMQRALENIAASTALTTVNRVVYALGSDLGSQAYAAAKSAFDLSSLATNGWTFNFVGNLTDASLATALSLAGIVMLDSGGNVGGGLTTGEQSVLTANAAAINSFVGGGGGLFSQSHGYGWLSALVPGLTVTQIQEDGLTLTPAGAAAFPGLTNADLSAGPWHNYFNNVGSIPVLATGLSGGQSRAVVIGAAGGSITNPEPPVGVIPEPETYALMGAGLAALGFVSRRRKQQQAKAVAA